MMVVAWPAPTIFSESLTDNAPWFPVQSLVTRASDNIYVPAGRLTVSVPAVALAFRIASRRLQSFATPAQAFAIGDMGTGSSVRLTVKVGSGSGIMTDGALAP